MISVAILRPEPGATETLRRAQALGLNAFALPLFVIEPVDWAMPDGAFDALLLTSANAVRMAGPKLPVLDHLPVHAVGDATARAARERGLEVSTVGDGDVASLLDRLGSGERLLHLAGEDRTEFDSRRGQQVTAVAVYRSRALEAVDGLERLADGLALVHSPRAARRLGELIDYQGLDRSSITIAALSPSVAGAVGPGWRQVAAAGQRNDDALLALAGKLCKMSGRA